MFATELSEFMYMKPHLSVLAFVACALDVISKKSLPRAMSRSFCTTFSSRRFYAFRSYV